MPKNSTTEKMRILCIIPYAGSEKLTEMTARMLAQLYDCIEYAQFHMGLMVDQIKVCLFANKPDVLLNEGQRTSGCDDNVVAFQMESPENVGFGRAINMAIRAHWDQEFTHYLILNNDLEFPFDDWLEALLDKVDDVEDFFVLSPCTDNTANRLCVTEGPRTGESLRLGQVSAYAWLVPHRVCKAIVPRFGFELFDPEFFCYGEDDYTGAILRKLYGGTPFKLVYGSWVKHLKGQTGTEFKLKSGMKENIDLLKRKLKGNGLK